MFPKKLFHPIVVWKQSFSSSKTSSIIDNGFGLVGTNPLLSWQENVITYLKEALVLFSIPSDGPFVCAYVWLASITTTRTICIPSCIGEIRGRGWGRGCIICPIWNPCLFPSLIFVGASQPRAKKRVRGLSLSLKRRAKEHVIIRIHLLFTYMRYTKPRGQVSPKQSADLSPEIPDKMLDDWRHKFK